MAYLGTKPANQVIDSTLIADGTVTPADLSTGKPVWDTIGNVGIGATTFSNVRLLTKGGNTASDSYAFLAENSAGTDLFAITNAGNVGINNSSPTFADSRNGLSVKGATANGAEVIVQTSTDTGSVGLALVKFGNDTAVSNRSNGNMLFGTNNTERMRIDSSGNLLVGTTSSTSARLTIEHGTELESIYIRNTASTAGRRRRITVDPNNTFYVLDENTTGVYLSQGSTSWVGLSDERLKTDLTPIADAVSKVSSLRAVTGRFKTDEEGVSRSFLIAQDVQAVLPEAVDVRDDEQGTLGVRYTDTIPLLVAAIKEQQALIQSQADIISAMESRLTALESK